MQKTIFITIFQAVEAKNILRTPILQTLLRDPEVRLVLLTDSEDKVNYHKKEFNSERLIYEVVPRIWPRGLDKFFSGLKYLLLRTDTTDMRRRMTFIETGKRLAYYSNVVLNLILARPIIRRLARSLDLRIVKNAVYAPYFEKYRPDLVFMAHLFDDQEIHLLREAKRRKVKTIGFINSWDKVTARCIVRLLPDKAVVFNDIVKQEIMAYDEMDEQDVFVSGLPHYDAYVNRRPGRREDFYKELGIQPSTKHIVVYAPNGKFSKEADGLMIDLLRSLIDRSLVPEGTELLVRFQPNDAVDPELLEARPWLKYDVPGTRFSNLRGTDWDMSDKDTQRLMDTLYHASLFICYTSSLSVDAAVFGKPVINVNFELQKIEKPSESPIQYYQMAHYKNAIRSGGIKVVNDKDELLRWINVYLENPGIDEDKRKRLVHEQCGPMDGRAGERIGSFTLNYLGDTSARGQTAANYYHARDSML